MTVSSIRKTTKQFLQTLAKENLIKLTAENFNAKRIKQKQKRGTIVGNTFQKLMKLNPKNYDISEEEWIIFEYRFVVSSITSNLELVKTLLMLCIDDRRVAFYENTTFENFFRLICDELGFNEKQRNQVFHNFFVDFRNSVSQIGYDITKDGLFIDLGRKTVHYDLKKLTDIREEIAEINKTLTEFVEEHVGKLEKSQEEIEAEKQELMRHVKEYRQNLLSKQKLINQQKNRFLN